MFFFARDIASKRGKERQREREAALKGEREKSVHLSDDDHVVAAAVEADHASGDGDDDHCDDDVQLDGEIQTTEHYETSLWPVKLILD